MFPGFDDPRNNFIERVRKFDKFDEIMIRSAFYIYAEVSILVTLIFLSQAYETGISW